MPLTESPHEGRHLDVDGMRLFVVERGLEGYPLVALHPLGRDHWVFADYLDGLAPDLHVVLADQRGHGMSDPADEVTVEQLAADVGGLADVLELDRYALLAHGDAAAVAAAHAAAAPERVSHVILLPDGEQPGGEYQRRSAPGIERGPRVGAGPDRSIPDGVPVTREDTAYPFVHDQDAFLARVRAFVLG